MSDQHLDNIGDRQPWDASTPRDEVAVNVAGLKGAAKTAHTSDAGVATLLMLRPPVGFGFSQYRSIQNLAVGGDDRNALRSNDRSYPELAISHSQ
jgi:hypothetical protein